MILVRCFRDVYSYLDHSDPKSKFFDTVRNMPTVKLPTTLAELESAVKNSAETAFFSMLVSKLSDLVPALDPYDPKNSFATILSALRADPMKFLDVGTLNLDHFARQMLNDGDNELWNPTDAEMQDIVDRSGASKALAESVMKAFRLLK